jgi:regulator of replication initiation timing
LKTEIETLKEELVSSKIEIEHLRMRLKNAELMYQFAAAELQALRNSAPAGGWDHPLSN